ncbi:hypothetical protein B484DRAFT_70042 [Ochromonadaceae sp. CCMP2298]|nr:hypothetical protein B484DRAFT_70042 [Ochromonadaceae sp. CCMP2298]
MDREVSETSSRSSRKVISSTPNSPVVDEGMDVRNVVSWRVPNNPKLPEIPLDDTPSKRALVSPVSQGAGNGSSSLKIAVPSMDGAPSPGDRGSVKSAKPDTSDEPGSRSSYGSKLWRILFANLIRSIDELYENCEEHEEMARCAEVVELLERSRRDFHKLIERIVEQGRFEMGALPGGISWEVRMPSLPSPLPDHTPNIRVTLSASATPFEPGVGRALLFPSSVFSPSAKDVGINTVPVGDSDRSMHLGHSAPTGLGDSRLTRQRTAAAEAAEEARLQAEVQQASEQVWAEAEAWVEAEIAAEEQEWQLLAVGINKYLKEAAQLLDQDTEDDLGPAGEGLRLRPDHSGLRGPVSTPEGTKRPPGLAMAHSTEALVGRLRQLGTIEGGTSGGTLWEGKFVALSPEQRAIWEESPLSDSGLLLARNSNGGVRADRRVSRKPTTEARSIVFTPTARRVGAQGAERDGPSGSDSPISIATSVGLELAQPTAHRPSPRSPLASARGSRDRVARPTNSPNIFRGSSSKQGSSAGSSTHSSPTRPGARMGTGFRYSSPSPSSSTANSASGGRSLHDKLSSPDRKRSISPTEALRRNERRHTNAEQNRDNAVAHKVQKASIASQRVRLMGEKEAQRRAEGLQALEEKLHDASQRHSQYLRRIQHRAYSESAKVSGVLVMNAEAIARKLEEVEARVEAAAARRQERLQGLSKEQNRKNSCKVQQISEWRLQFERQKMDRWDKLQQRLESVTERRAQRLDELQRRVDEQRRSGKGGGAGQGSPERAPSGKTLGTDHEKDCTPDLRDPENMGAGRSSNTATFQARPVHSKISTGTLTEGEKASEATYSQEGSDSAGSEVVEEEEIKEEKKGRSKSQAKKDKRRLLSVLVCLAEEADYVAMHESVRLTHSEQQAAAVTALASTATTAAPTASVSHARDIVPNVNASAGRAVRLPSSFPNTTFTEAVRTEAVDQISIVVHCPAACVEAALLSCQQAARKKAVVAARNELADSGLAKIGAEEAGTGGSGACRLPAAERAYLEELRRAEPADTNRLTQHVCDLIHADPPSTFSMQSMQRQYLLLQDRAISDSVGNAGSHLSCALLLRMLLGPEVGMLRDAASAQCVLDALSLLPLSVASCSSTAAQEREVRCEALKLALELLLACAAEAEGARMLVQCGVGAVLVDLLQVLLATRDAYRRGVANGDGDTQVFRGDYPGAVNHLAAVAGIVLARMVDSTESQALGDALVWYAFSTQQVQVLADALRTHVHHWQLVQSSLSGESDGLSSSELLLAAVVYMDSLMRFIRSSAGLGSESDWLATDPKAESLPVLVESTLQLSPARHRHSRGRLLVSVARRAEPALALLDLLGALATDIGSEKTQTFGDRFVLLGATCRALENCSRADTCLVLSVAASSAQHALWVRSLGDALELLLQAVDGPVQFEVVSLASLALVPGGWGKEQVEASLRSLLCALGLVCLRHPAMQRACNIPPSDLLGCGSGQSVLLGGSDSTPGKRVSLLHRLATLSSKFFKDKRFKHALLPCLVAVSHDCDANTLLLARENKLPFLVNYVLHAVATMTALLKTQAKGNAFQQGGSQASVAYLQRLSCVLPSELWPLVAVGFARATKIVEEK